MAYRVMVISTDATYVVTHFTYNFVVIHIFDSYMRTSFELKDTRDGNGQSTNNNIGKYISYFKTILGYILFRKNLLPRYLF